MISATLFRYVKVLQRSPVDTVSMLLRPLVTVALMWLFASFYFTDSLGVPFVIISAALVNIIINSMQGSAFEAQEDAQDTRLDSIVMAPGGIERFIWAQALTQTFIALVQSLFILMIAIFVSNTFQVTVLEFLAVVTGFLSILVMCVGMAALGVWATVYHRKFFLVSFLSVIVVTLGGAFFSVDRLSPIFRGLGYANPVTYVIDVIRAPLTGTNVLIPLAIELAISIGFSSIILLVACVVTKISSDLSKIMQHS